eukprot:CAMPEP_0172639936 /NCGR_PEP_ID=MMETSP1068-20121228/220584_1 /TAXON_ID=35684 /ORGANISM="Pseudopedinella elastica, Strain CCMP716" /LENGTH=91 /DNA_ID=CAMNT_0013453191 /DNA_START=1 /DNA_END=276 /DNA_ORIENTATION=+
MTIVLRYAAARSPSIARARSSRMLSTPLPPPPDIPPPPPSKRNWVHPLLLSSFLGGSLWLYFKEPDEEDSLDKIPDFLKDLQPGEDASKKE